MADVNNLKKIGFANMKVVGQLVRLEIVFSKFLYCSSTSNEPQHGFRNPLEGLLKE
jgi:hypothetical protein